MTYYVAGYKFKPSHFDTHYLRGEFNPNGSYPENFTRNPDEAHRFSNCSLAQQTIDKVVDQFESDPEYKWTPVVQAVLNEPAFDRRSMTTCYTRIFKSS